LKKSPELCWYIKNNHNCPNQYCSRPHSQDEVSLIIDLKQQKLEREKKEAEEKRLAEEQMNEYKLLERKPELCQNETKYARCHDKNCKYAHSKSELEKIKQIHAKYDAQASQAQP
jgi:hypothetical protein